MKVSIVPIDKMPDFILNKRASKWDDLLGQLRTLEASQAVLLEDFGMPAKVMTRHLNSLLSRLRTRSQFTVTVRAEKVYIICRKQVPESSHA